MKVNEIYDKYLELIIELKKEIENCKDEKEKYFLKGKLRIAESIVLDIID